jgi:hypothetical protein
MAPQVGLEPTTLRLTASPVFFSGLLRFVRCCLLLIAYKEFESGRKLQNYLVFATFFI